MRFTFFFLFFWLLCPTFCIVRMTSDRAFGIKDDDVSIERDNYEKGVVFTTELTHSLKIHTIKFTLKRPRLI